MALKSAAALIALFYIPGLSWVWLFRPQSALTATAWSLAIGLPAILIPATFLAEAGFFTWGALWTLSGALTLIGLALGRARHFCYGHAGVAALTLALFAVFIWPQRGEWIAGGWDPGVNINQGLLIARTASVAQPPDPTRAHLLHDAPGAFSRDRSGFTEVFPGFPADAETGALRPYFYRATPTFIAIAARVGDRTAALRANHVLWIVAAIFFTALLANTQLPLPAVAFGAFAFSLQPIVLAHTATPASEMLELAIVCAVGLILVQRERASTALLIPLLFLGALNRASFLMHQALLLLVLVGWDAADKDRRSATLRHLAIAISLLLGAAWYLWITPDAVRKLQHLRPIFTLLFFGSIATAILADAIFARWQPPRTARALAFAPPLALVIREVFQRAPFDEFLRNAGAWIAYTPILLAALALIGLIAAARKSQLAPWLIWLATALLLALLRRHMVELYPWATKRWLAFSPPLIAAGLALLTSAAIRLSRTPRTIALLLISGLWTTSLPRTKEAWRSAEYNGATHALNILARNIRADDIVVSDHFLWGTPLALAYGATVMNAEPLLAGRGDVEQVVRALNANTRRVLLLTSTRQEMNIWPEPLRNAQPLTDRISLSTTTRIQHSKNRGFESQTSTSQLRLFLWTPTP